MNHVSIKIAKAFLGLKVFNLLIETTPKDNRDSPIPFSSVFVFKMIIIAPKYKRSSVKIHEYLRE